MNISSTFIERPIATSLMMLAIGLFGMVAYRSLPVSDLPNVDLPTLLVTASLPGASPETMAAAVATPLENNFSISAVAPAASGHAHAAHLHEGQSGGPAYLVSSPDIDLAAAVDLG